MNPLRFLYDLLLPKANYIIIPMLILMVGCGGPPAQNPLLTSATDEYKAAEQDEMVVRFAPVALKEAEETLEISRELWTAKADKSSVDHYAYLAKQRTFIARETALLNAANSEISRGEVERQQVLLEVRQSEADQSEARARRSLLEAQSERALAVEARQSAEQSRLSAEEAHQNAEQSNRDAIEAGRRTEEASQRADLLARRVNELEARPTDRGLVLTLGDVLFEFGKATMRSEGMTSMNDLSNFLLQYPERNVLIEGFTDNIGSESYNMELSRNRANSVKSDLVNRGIDESRIRIRGYGIQYPSASNATEDGRQKNRRVEVIISDQLGNISDRSR
ncbi:MAG: OmpA family protein [Balneolales bacterium]